MKTYVFREIGHPRPAAPAPFAPPGPEAAGRRGSCRHGEGRQPRPWRQFRLWIRQWPADPRVLSRSPWQLGALDLSLATSAGAAPRRSDASDVPRMRQPIGPPGLTSSPQPRVRLSLEPAAFYPASRSGLWWQASSVRADWVDKTDPELVSLAGEECEAGPGGGSERQGSARRTADTSEPRTQSLRPPVRSRDEGTDLGGRLWDAIAATDAQHPEATGGLLQ